MGNQSLKRNIEEEHEIVTRQIQKKVVTDPDTKVVLPLESLWTKHDGPTVIIFFRRWNCRICKLGAAEISEVRDDLERKYGSQTIGFYGVGLDFIGFEQFRKKSFFKGKIYIDEGKTIYRALNYSRFSIKGVFNKNSFKRYMEAGKKGFEGDIVLENGGQLGGSLIVSPKGKVFYHKPQKYYGDDPNPEEILEQIQFYFKVSSSSTNIEKKEIPLNIIL